MVFRLSEETQGFKDTIRRFFENELDSVIERRVVDHLAGSDQQLIKAFSALCLNEIYCKKDQALESLPELALLASEAGRALCPEHLTEAIVAGPFFFSTFCDDQTNVRLQKAIGVDRMRLLLSGEVAVLRTPLFYQDSSALSVKESASNYSLSGALRLIPNQSNVEYLLYVEQHAAYLIDKNQSDKIALHAETALDTSQARVRVVFNEANAFRINITTSWIYHALSRILVAAEILGVCQKVFEMTVDYVKIRQQFSQPIGAFQALQHALADIYQKIEMLDSLLSFSVWNLRTLSSQSELSSQSLLRLALREGVGIVEKAIQLHGGIGFTWEHELHFYLRRVRSLVALAGNQVRHEEPLLKAVRQTVLG